MRHDKVNGDDRLLVRENIDDRLMDSSITPEELEALVAKANQSRSRATTELLRRSGAAMVRCFRRWTRPDAGRAHLGAEQTGPADRQPQGGV